MTTPIGPALSADAASKLNNTTCTQALLIASGNVAMSTLFNAGFCRRVVAQAAGNVAISRQGDAGVFTVYAVTAGYVIEGIIAAIGGTGAGSTAITVNLEL